MAVFFTCDGEVYRAISAEALHEWNSLIATQFFRRFVDEKRIVTTEIAKVPPPSGDWAAVLHHERIPFISYPYEWTFSMLHDAALLQLELLLATLKEGFILKDSSAYNYQWQGCRPVLIDVLSLKKLNHGDVWAGYRQFCQMFLYPLLLQSYKQVAFQPWLRGSIDGISPADINHVFSATDLLRPGVFTHIYLQSKLQDRMGATNRNLKSELQQAGFSKDMVIANVRRLHRLVSKLQWQPANSEWSVYTSTTSYSIADAAAKEAFVHAAVESQRWNLVWDIGCNTGQFSRIAAKNADYVVALDADSLVVERFYQSLRQEQSTHILPLVMSLSDMSPGLGWRAQERKALTERGSPDLILSLALIHHIVISANIPMRDFVDWLASFHAALVIEFVTREDPMVKKLLLNKEDQYGDYTAANFEKCLSQHFHIVRKQPLASATRLLYFAQPRE